MIMNACYGKASITGSLVDSVQVLYSRAQTHCTNVHYSASRRHATVYHQQISKPLVQANIMQKLTYLQELLDTNCVHQDHHQGRPQPQQDTVSE